MSRSKVKSVSIKTGDGKTLVVDKNIGRISKMLETHFATNNEIYLENVSERAVQRILEYYDITLGFTEKQKEMFKDPNNYKSKLKKKLRDSDPDKDVVELYLEYTDLPTEEFYEFMKAAWAMKIMPLVEVCAYITAARISGVSINKIEKMLCKESK